MSAKYFKFLAGSVIIHLVVACGKSELSSYSGGNSFVVSGLESGSMIDSMIRPYRESMREFMSAVVGRADSTLEKYGPESPLGNFMADITCDAGVAVLQKSDIPGWSHQNAFALLNFGGFRSTIQQGEITRQHVYELMPFDNALSIVKISSDSVHSMMRYLAGCEGQPVSNASAILTDHGGELSIGGSKYNFNGFVFIITSDYLADGGDEMHFMSAPVERWDTGILIRDIIFNYLTIKSTLRYWPVEGRMQLVEE